MRLPKNILIPVLCVLAALMVALWWANQPAAKPDAKPVAGAPTRPSHGPPSQTGSPLTDAIARLQEKPPRADSLKSLKELQASLNAMSRDEAVASIMTFFDAGKDQNTGLDLEIAAGGTLTAWPSMRTFLLDVLFSIDPEAAAELSRRILASPTTADEWALALRNLGRTTPSAETTALLIEKTEALIGNAAWQANPSIGYLNAFDVLVHTRATASTPLLSSLIQQKDRRDLAHAGFLTLDRLVQRSPTEVLPMLATDRTLQQSRPEMVAQQFARADLRDPAQQQMVKTWLLDPARTGTELRSFAGVYPNNNRFISNNLLTTESQQSGAELAEHDRQVLDIINSWSADPAFQSVAEHLRTMSGRLKGFVGSPQPSVPQPPVPTTD